MEKLKGERSPDSADEEYRILWYDRELAAKISQPQLADVHIIYKYSALGRLCQTEQCHTQRGLPWIRKSWSTNETKRNRSDTTSSFLVQMPLLIYTNCLLHFVKLTTCTYFSTYHDFTFMNLIQYTLCQY